jgi:hypothetical protein
MDKTINISNSKPDNVKPKPRRRRGPAARISRGESPKRPKKYQPGEFKRKLLLIGIETLSLSITAVLVIMVLLGYSANRFSGTSFFGSLLPIIYLADYLARYPR